MTKRTITTWWLVGAIVLIVGGLLALFSSLALVPHIQQFSDNFKSNNFVPDSYFWTLISLIILGGIAVLGGILVQFVIWVGAVINTNRLADKTWFNIMLWVGVGAIVLNLLSGPGTLIGWGLMIVYLIGGPDGTAMEPIMLRPAPVEPLRPAPVEPPRPLAPTG